MSRTRIIVADDHAIVAEGLRVLLAPHFEVVATVEDGRELVEAVAKHSPDLIVLDLSMPILNGLDAFREIRRAGSRAKAVFLTASADVAVATQAFRDGASGYVLKQSAAGELVTAIQEAMQGRTYVTPRIANEVLQNLMQGGAPHDELTPRERQVLQLLAEGKSAKEIGALLDFSPRTAEFHKYNIMEKTGLRTTAELARYAERHGLVERS